MKTMGQNNGQKDTRIKKHNRINEAECKKKITIPEDLISTTEQHVVKRKPIQPIETE